MTPPGAPPPSPRDGSGPSATSAVGQFVRRMAGVSLADVWTPTLWLFGLLAWGLFFGLFVETMNQFDQLMNPPPDEATGAVDTDAP